MMTITYEASGRDGLYINLTNRCPCNCTFCLRNHADGVYGSDSLWLDHDPSLEEICESIDQKDLNNIGKSCSVAMVNRWSGWMCC